MSFWIKCQIVSKDNLLQNNHLVLEIETLKGSVENN